MFVTRQTASRLLIGAIAKFFANSAGDFRSAIHDADVKEDLLYFQLGQRCPDRACHLLALRMLGDPLFHAVKNRFQIEWPRKAATALLNSDFVSFVPATAPILLELIEGIHRFAQNIILARKTAANHACLDTLVDIWRELVGHNDTLP